MAMMAMVRSRTMTMTEYEYKQHHAKFKIIYGFHPSPFGDCLLGMTNTDKAIAFLAFVDGGGYEKAFTELQNDWFLSELVEDNNETNQVVQSIFSPVAEIRDSLTLLLMGSEFQIKVWQCLLGIPMGTSVTYEQVAFDINNPKGACAVGNAIMKNKIGYLVPCHRVKSKYRVQKKYKWGIKIKEAIIFYEYKLSVSGTV